MKARLNKPEVEFSHLKDYELSMSLKLFISIPVLIVILFILLVYGYLIFCDPNYIDPQKFGFPTILVTLIVVLIVINIPWNKLGFRIKKIGMIELEQVVKGQAADNANELADLQSQIDELKEKLNDNTKPLDTSLDELVLDFLKTNSTRAFSSVRIKNLVEEKDQFLKFKPLESKKIRASLRRLLDKGKLLTKISSRGNTLYKFKN